MKEGWGGVKHFISNANERSKGEAKGKEEEGKGKRERRKGNWK